MANWKGQKSVSQMIMFREKNSYTNKGRKIYICMVILNTQVLIICMTNLKNDEIKNEVTSFDFHTGCTILVYPVFNLLTLF